MGVDTIVGFRFASGSCGCPAVLCAAPLPLSLSVRTLACDVASAAVTSGMPRTNLAPVDVFINTSKQQPATMFGTEWFASALKASRPALVDIVDAAPCAFVTVLSTLRAAVSTRLAPAEWSAPYCRSELEPTDTTATRMMLSAPAFLLPALLPVFLSLPAPKALLPSLPVSQAPFLSLTAPLSMTIQMVYLLLSPPARSQLTAWTLLSSSMATPSDSSGAVHLI